MEGKVANVDSGRCFNGCDVFLLGKVEPIVVTILRFEDVVQLAHLILSINSMQSKFELLI